MTHEGITELVGEAHEVAFDKGFYEDIETTERYLKEHGQHALAHIAVRTFVLSQLALIGTEVSEAAQALREKDVGSDELTTELADVVIRVCDLAGYLGADLERAIHKKMAVNRTRPRKHGRLC